MKKDFNPADYDYMDDMPLEGWIWEFIRRSQVYSIKLSQLEYVRDSLKQNNKAELIEYESKIKELLNEIKDIGIEARIMFGKNDSNLLKEWGDSHICFEIFKNKDNEKKGKYLMCIPNPDFKFVEFPYPVGAFIPSARSWKFWPGFDLKSKIDILHDSVDPYYVCNELTIDKIEDTLYCGISRSSNIDDIEKRLLPVIKSFLIPRKQRTRTDKWKYYFIVYDLTTQNIRYKEIADLLRQEYPENINLFDEKNIENYYKNALTLINGDYNKYLYFKK